MSTTEIDLTDFEALIRDAQEGIADLTRDVGRAVLEAAEAGTEEARHNHPYTDRTFRLSGEAHAEPTGADDFEPEAEMVWPTEYAGYVDEGTSRSRAYPFTPQAEQRAQASLDRNVERALDKYERKLT